jgi:hypothetical protein
LGAWAWVTAGAVANAGHTGEASHPPLTAAEIRSAARGLSYFVPQRATCGDGAAFAGRHDRVTAKLDAWDSARVDEATNAVCQGIVSRMGELSDVVGHQEITAVLRSSCDNLFHGFYVATDYREHRATDHARNDLNSIRGWLNAFQGTATSVVNGSHLARPATDAERAKANEVLAAIRQVRAKIAQITPAFRAAAHAADCQEAELNIRFWIAKAARAETPENSDGTLVDTFSGHDLVVEGSHCHTLEQFGDGIENVLRLTDDTTDVLTQNWQRINGGMDDLTREERAVVVQMTADYIQHHGGPNGHLSRDQRVALSTTVLATIERFIRYHDEHATNPVPPPAHPPAST